MSQVEYFVSVKEKKPLEEGDIDPQIELAKVDIAIGHELRRGNIKAVRRLQEYEEFLKTFVYDGDEKTTLKISKDYEDHLVLSNILQSLFSTPKSSKSPKYVPSKR